jgi:hypothetical protein
MIRSTFLAMIFALSGAAWAPIAFAETDDSTPPSTSSEQASAPYSDAELKSFAVALLEVDRIKTTYAPKLALTLRAQQEVKQAASQEMVQALKQQGMSVDKYQEILINVQTNPALAGKVDRYLKETAKQKIPDAKSPDQTTPDETSPDDESTDQQAPVKPSGAKKAERV